MSLKRQFLWNTAPLLVITVVNVVSVRLFLEWLGPEKYALWFYVGTFTGIFGFADLGLGAAVSRYIGVALGKGDHAAVRQYWGTGNLVAIPLLGVTAIIFIVTGVFLGPIWFHNISPENVIVLQWAFVWGGVGLFVGYYTQFWWMLSQAHLDFKFIGILRAVFAIVQVFVFLALAYYTRNPVLLVFSGVVMGLLQLAAYVWHGVRKYNVGLNFRDASRARAMEMSQYTLKTFASMLAGGFFGSIDRMLIGRFDPIAFTNYNISYNVGSRVQGLSVAIMGPVFHNTSRAVGKSGEKSAATIFNETFNFTFGWYALFSIWMTVWHPAFLIAWLGPANAAAVTPAFVPVVVAACLSSLANNSAAQLGPLNRMGMQLFFSIATSIVLGICVIAGWYWGGLAGIGWGVLASRAVLIAQDLYVIRLIGSKGGWLAVQTWRHLTGQCVLALGFSAVYLVLPRDSIWIWPFALAHGFGVAAWLLRHQVRRFFERRMTLRSLRETPPASPVDP